MHTHSCTRNPIVIPERPLGGEEKKLADHMLSSIVRPHAVVKDIVAGSKFIVVTAGGRMGLSSLLGTCPREHEKDLEHQMVGKDVKEAAALIRKPSAFSICLGFAALNAGNVPDPNQIEPSNFPADELIARLGKNKITGLVEDFPFVEQLKTRVGTLHLFELGAVPDAVPRDQWESVLAGIEVLAVTGTALLTRSMSWFLSRAARAKIVILGPTTPFSPVLFNHGADYLCGSVVTDIEKVAQGIRAGLPFKQVKKNGGIIFTQWAKD